MFHVYIYLYLMTVPSETLRTDKLMEKLRRWNVQVRMSALLEL